MTELVRCNWLLIKIMRGAAATTADLLWEMANGGGNRGNGHGACYWMNDYVAVAVTN